jgi:hypothetical protein
METNQHIQRIPSRRGQYRGVDPWYPAWPWDDDGRDGHADDHPAPTLNELDRIARAARLGGGSGVAQ